VSMEIIISYAFIIVKSIAYILLCPEFLWADWLSEARVYRRKKARSQRALGEVMKLQRKSNPVVCGRRAAEY